MIALKGTVFVPAGAIYFVKRMKNSIFVICKTVFMGFILTADEIFKDSFK